MRGTSVISICGLWLRDEGIKMNVGELRESLKYVDQEMDVLTMSDGTSYLMENVVFDDKENQIFDDWMYTMPPELKEKISERVVILG